MAFLKALSETGSVAQAAVLVDVDRTTPYTWRHTLPGFAAAEQATRPQRHASFALPPGRMNEPQLLYVLGMFLRSAGPRLRNGGHESRHIPGQEVPSCR